MLTDSFAATLSIEIFPMDKVRFFGYFPKSGGDMHIGQAANSFSDLLSVKLSRVQSVCKYLRDAGFIPTGGRGPNAPHLKDLEIARILVTLMTIEVPGDAKERCEYFCSLPIALRASSIDPKRAADTEQWTLEQMLASLFQGVRNGTIKTFEMADFRKASLDEILGSTSISLEIDISFGRVEIRHKTNQFPLCFSQNDMPYSKEYHPCPFFSPMRKMVSIDHDTIEQVAAFGSAPNDNGGSV